MPIVLSPLAYQEKNSLASNGIWAILVEIYIPQLDDYIRVTANNEDITWNGHVWQSFPFEMDEMFDSTKGEIPQLSIRICNINGVAQYYIESANGATGSSVKIMVINTNTMASNNAPEIELDFTVKSTSVDAMWATFVLGVTNPFSIMIGQRMIRTGCRFNGINGTQNGFKGSRCKYSGAQTECNKTLTRCRELGNSVNFGGFTGIGVGNTFYV